MSRKVRFRVRHIPVSPPCIGRRRCGVRLPHSFGDMGELNQPASQPSYPPLAWGSARAGEDISEHRSVRITEKDEQGAQIGLRALITRIAAVSGNPRGLLKVRAAVGSDLEAKLPAMDKSRTTETARLDRIAFPARSHNAAPALTDLGARHIASARCRLTDGPGLVHETLPAPWSLRSN
jgi:hypothetical protein